MNGTTWALLSAYARHLKQQGERTKAERLASRLFAFEPPRQELSAAISTLEDQALMHAYQLTPEGFCVAEGMARAGGL